VKKIRVLTIWVLSMVLLAALPEWLPSPPSGDWRIWWSWSLADPQRGLALAAGCLAMLIAAWLFVLSSLVLSVAAADPSGRAVRLTIDWLTPRVARGLVRGLLGAAVAVSTVGTAAPALAAGSTSALISTATVATPSLSPVPAPLVAAPDLPPLLELDRPDAVAASPAPAPTTTAPPRRRHPKPRPTPRPTPTPTPTPTSTALPDDPATPTLAAPIDPTQTTHRVRPGDTLWALAAAQLPAGSSPAVITADWQHWYEANRAAIGADPDLLLVGEQLVIPQETP
jgi:outer membrane biosynthesis protein TonB